MLAKHPSNPESEPTGMASSINRHVKYWQHLGFPKEQLKEIYGAHYDQLHNTQHRIPVKLTGYALDSVSEYFNDETVAFRTGLNASISSLQAMSHVLLTCPSVRHFISLATQFQQLATQGYQMLFNEGDCRSSVDIFVPSYSPFTNKQIELNIGIIFKLVADIISDYESFNPVIHIKHYNQQLQTPREIGIDLPIMFNCKKNSVSFDSSILDKPLCSPSKATFDLNKLTAKKQLQEVRLEQGLPELCKGIIKQYLCDGAANLEVLAGLLQINKRVLQARLSDQNTTFRRLLDIARKEKLETLDINSLSKREMAQELGFTTCVAFEESYKRWKNISYCKSC